MRFRDTEAGKAARSCKRLFSFYEICGIDIDDMFCQIESLICAAVYDK